jgi:gluconolactonase
MKLLPAAAAVLATTLAAFNAGAAGLATPGIAGVVNANTAIELVNAGFAGSDGPLGLSDGSLIFAEPRAARITRIDREGKLSTALDDSGGARALAIGPHGELYAAQGSGGIARIFPPQQAGVLAASTAELPIGAAQDLVLGQLGRIYFTAAARDATPAGIYCIERGGTRVRRVADGPGQPQGIQLSPDERLLYVSDRASDAVVVFDVADDGSLGTAKPFARLASPGAGGLTIDARGRLYAASRAGVEVFSPRGEALGLIELPQPAQNVAFAGPGKRTLYAVGSDVVFRIALNASGYAGRAK